MNKQPDNSADELRDLNLALGAFRAKDQTFTDRYNYYDGFEALKYSTERLRKIFEKMDVFFSENWCSVIVDSVLERIGIQGWVVEDNEDLQKQLRLTWAKLGIQLDANDVHEAASICGEGFIIAERETDFELFYNDPRMCHLFYEPDDPKKKRVGAKIWKDDDGRYRVDLYYPDRISNYVTAKADKFPKDSRSFVFDPAESGPNKFEEIPIFHFRLHRRRIIGDLTRSIISLQDASNKLISDLMASSEYDTFKERIYITSQSVKNLKRAPGMRTRLRPSPQGMQNADVKEFGGSDLKNFITPLERFANSMAIISRTPRHYFFSVGAGISGDALLAMEAPLVAKAMTYRESLGVTWQELGAFVAKSIGTEVPAEAIQLSWKPAETIQPLARAQEIQSLAAAGFDKYSAARISGIGEDEIKKAKDEEQKAGDQLAKDSQAALDAARKVALEQAGTNAGAPGATPAATPTPNTPSK
jgi:hypothetical protein